MKTIVQFKEMTPADRAKNLKSRTRKDDETKKEIAKILVAAEEAGDFGKGEMNAWSLRITGIELRREVQGTYEFANVLRGIRSGELPFTEEEFDKAPKFGLIKLAGFMGKKDSEKVAAALEIIRSRLDVTNRLRELSAKPKEPKAEESKDSESAESGESLNSGTTPAPAAPAPKGVSFFVPEGEALLNQPEVQARILADIRTAESPQVCEAYHEFFKDLVAQIHTRWEHLEAEAAKSTESAPAAEAVAA